ncbi:uncharacterized protein LOC132723861 [Ruditapes philippinarum]|uniref:uncharacterized protein LOC132723861 n=1 Tax=Ruditapes philippinarum TaxID=129788 RepID=UPI00295BE554|nr:uncharacterized protein LOC132723861 [Ruditapes philippinarum]
MCACELIVFFIHTYIPSSNCNLDSETLAMPKKNPGKNIKGQKCRAKKHHSGPVSDTFVSDTKARRETKCKRLKSLKKNIQMLSKRTGVELLLQWRDGADNPVETFLSEGCKISQNVTDGINESVQQISTNASAQYPDHPHQVEHENSDQCNICFEAHVGRKKKCLWINCSENKCEFWVHALCVGIVGKKEDIEHINYYCPEHIKKFK